LVAASGPPEPSATTPNQDTSGRVLPAASTVSFSLTSGWASMKLTVMLVSGVNRSGVMWA
jgi:hypothetical protein